ncbi:uncharacterized protein B4U79_14077, partial [Dinothrombium tinctorium]
MNAISFSVLKANALKSSLKANCIRIEHLNNVWRRALSSNANQSNVNATREDEEDNDKPVKYTTSKAHTEWKSAYTFRTVPDPEQPTIQRPVMVGSLVVFMVYFFCLREENDLDEELYKPLFERLPHLEKPMIEDAIKNFKIVGKDTTELEQRLKELKERDAKAAAAAS